MPRTDRNLLLAGAAAAVGLMAATAAVTIALIAVVSPPLVTNSTAELDAAMASSARSTLAVALFGLLLSLGGVYLVVRRRPFLSARDSKQLGGPGWPPGVLVALAVFFCMLAAWQLWSTLRAIQADTARPLTRSLAFHGLAFPCMTLVIGGVVLSTLLMKRWWFITNRGRAESGARPALEAA